MQGVSTPNTKRATLNKRLSLTKPSSPGMSSGGAASKANVSPNLPKINASLSVTVTGQSGTPGSSSPAAYSTSANSSSSSRLVNPQPPFSFTGTAQPLSPSNARSGSSPVLGQAAASPVNATIVLRRPPSPLSANNLLSIGLQAPSPSHSRRNSHSGYLNVSPSVSSHARSLSGGIPLPFEEGGHAPLTPRGASSAPVNDLAFDAVDDLALGNAAYRDVFRIVRLIAAQPSCDQMVLVLEKHARHLVKADVVRVLLVTRHGFTHPTLSQALSLDQGIASHSIHRRECTNLSHPAGDARFSADTDQLGEKAPLFYGCVPVEGDPQPSCSGPRDVVALIQVFKERDGSTPFTTTDMKIIQRLAEFVGNMLLRSRHADRAYALYNSSVSTQKRSAALLDVAKALASETRLSDVVSIIVSQVPEMLDSDRCTLFFVDRERGELIVTRGASHGRHKNLVSWIFGQSNAPELPFREGENEIRFSMANGIAGHVARTGETINIEDAHKDPRFNPTVDKNTGYRTRSLLCVPMIDAKGEIIGVVQCQ